MKGSKRIQKFGNLATISSSKKDKSRNLTILRSFYCVLKALGNCEGFFKPNDMVRNML